ncbi:hypothetical protein HNY73_021509 [Argiope bruennichi]|uniref:N-acetyltransferase domain-containing protein n=1 Tax=Argiope bruennichi TaxID=94029 RepID=A0A8T0DYR4_ARGBR|nr:hypothetical protein HNY73_021509 [Argiope bruennichi]
MGYGMRALQLLQEFYEGKCISLDENLKSRCKLTDNLEDNSAESPILQQLTEIRPDEVEYILVSCNLSLEFLSIKRTVGTSRHHFLLVYSSECDFSVFQATYLNGFGMPRDHSLRRPYPHVPIQQRNVSTCGNWHRPSIVRRKLERDPAPDDRPLARLHDEQEPSSQLSRQRQELHVTTQFQR